MGEQELLIKDMNLNELWNYAWDYYLDEATPKHKELIEMCLMGINIKFPIHWTLEKHYSIYPENNSLAFKGINKIKLSNYYLEIDTRKALLRRVLREINEGENIIIGRLE